MLFSAHKDNKKHYGFFQHNSFKFKDKLIRLFAEKIATGQHAHPAGQDPPSDNNLYSPQPSSDNDSIEGEPEEGAADDDDLSVISQRQRAARRAEGNSNYNKGGEEDPFAETPLLSATPSTAPALTRSATPATSTTNKRKRSANNISLGGGGQTRAK
jgi:hypothetical protein